MPTGRTQDAGWQAGLRRTLPCTRDELWKLVASDEGQEAWLGETLGTLRPGTRYALTDGTHGEIRVVEAGAQVRVTRRIDDDHKPVTLQVRTLRAKAGATLALHAEHLTDETAREAELERFGEVIDTFERIVAEREDD